MLRRTRFASCYLLLALLLLAPAAFAQTDEPISFGADNANVHAGNGAGLTGPSSAPGLEIVSGFLADRVAPSTLDSLAIESEADLGSGELTQLRLAQQVGGLEVYGTYVKATLDSNGRLVHLMENLAPVGAVQPARIGAADALGAALSELHPSLAGDFGVQEVEGNTTVFTATSDFWRSPFATRVAIPMRSGKLQEGFLVETWTDEDNLLHHTLVGANGRILGVELRTATDSYNIFPDHPDNSVQTIVAGPGAGNTESPVGWLFSSGQLSVNISGNNTHAYLDTDANNSPDAGGVSITDGNFVSVADLTQDPSIFVNQEVAVQNLFYFNNVVHDKLYRHGFVESVGNFQVDNFGKGGSGNDPVLAEAQDGSGLNNANFSTPSDGSSGRMQMFLWDLTTPRRDGDVDSDIIWHEYGHGLTWRMIGSMSGAMSGAVGEGNSDVLSIWANGNDVVGEYATNDPLGIRSAPYTDYPRTYGDFDGGSVHFDGEIYAAILWDLLARYEAAGITADTAWDDMVGGMNFTPAGPAFEDMRDGILQQADSARDCLIWESFAKFGVGVNADAQVSSRGPFNSSVTVTEDFSLPPECTSCVVTESPEVSCNDGLDNDCDGAVDSGDSDCSGSCTITEDPEISCNDGLDNDCDGFIDADDADCQSCVLVGDACTVDGDCCSNKCRGPSGRKTCK